MNSSLQRPTWLHRLIALLGGAALLLGVAWLDTLTGPNIHIGVVYWIPVGLAAWYAGRWPSYLLMILAIVLWHRFSVPPTDYLLPLNLQLWNIFIRVVYYPAVAETAIYLR